MFLEQSISYSKNAEIVLETEDRGETEHGADTTVPTETGNEVHNELQQFEEVQQEDLLHSADDQTSEEEHDDGNNCNDAELREKQMAWVKSKKTTAELVSDEEGEGVSSQYYDSDEPPSYYSESEKEEVQISEVHSKVQVKENIPSYNPASESKDLQVDMLFEDGTQFKTALINYAVHHKRDIRWVKNEPRRLQAKCENKKCPFKCTASWAEQYKCFQMKTWDETHRCNQKFKLMLVSQKWLEDKYENKIMDNPSIGKVELQKEIRIDLNIHVNISKVKRVIAKVLKKVNESFGDQFRRVRDYAAECIRSNPGSTVIVKTQRLNEDGPEVFQRMYVCFGALKRGFLSGCRKVLGLDGCFLKGMLKGEILSAVGRDANNEMYPIAWAVVEIENTETWRWFLNLLKEDLEINNSFHWTLMTDQQKGLVNVIKELLPNAEHRNCCRHIHANWSKKHKGKVLKKHFWICARCTTEAHFQQEMKALEKIDSSAKADLELYPTSQWCKAFFRVDAKCDILDNNLSECFNNTIVNARSKPIIPMLEAIRVATMKRIAKKVKFSAKWPGRHGPRIMKKLNASILHSMGWKVVFNGDDGYEVKRGKHQFQVRLQRKSCSCRAWDLSGIPCPHAVCAIFDKGDDPDDYVDDCYSKEVYDRIYSHHLEPINGELLWQQTQNNDIAPPIPKKLTGRPKKKRTREANEVASSSKGRTTVSRKGRVMKCSKCKEVGHNKAKCPNKSTDTHGTTTEVVHKPSKRRGKTQEKEGCDRPQKKRRSHKEFGTYKDPETGEAIVDPGLQSEHVL